MNLINLWYLCRQHLTPALITRLFNPPRSYIWNPCSTYSTSVSYHILVYFSYHQSTCAQSVALNGTLNISINNVIDNVTGHHNFTFGQSYSFWLHSLNSGINLTWYIFFATSHRSNLSLNISSMTLALTDHIRSIVLRTCYWWSVTIWYLQP